ncbi:hypothetical protein CKW39_08755 [Kocuria sp. WRN011]|uniref:hypothetical protein n=1 Tax=Kocuria sp. WRN011 TaxID=2029858 RepID=UPI000BAF2E8A|nr:hypothetical protein [Kocuria sp. WRN011]PBB08442.1 hypothetical protein CKW39_08755 [Kocuria sp. WRN011]
MHTITQEQRDQLLTDEIARRSGRVKDPLETTVVYRDDYAVCLKYSRPKAGFIQGLVNLSVGTIGGVVALTFHILLICISFGLWLIVLLLMALSQSKKNGITTPGLEIITVDDTGAVNTRKDNVYNEKTAIKKLQKAAKKREKTTIA